MLPRFLILSSYHQPDPRCSLYSLPAFQAQSLTETLTAIKILSAPVVATLHPERVHAPAHQLARSCRNRHDSCPALPVTNAEIESYAVTVKDRNAVLVQMLALPAK